MAESCGYFFSLRFYTPLDRALLWLVPPSLLKQQEVFDRLGRDRVRKLMLRIADEVDDNGAKDKKGHDGALPRNILSHLKSNKDEAIMTIAEIEANLHALVIGGVEIVATTLSGMINYLSQNVSALKALTNEVQSAAPHKADLTLANLSQLPCLTGVLKEGLRKGSPGPASLPMIMPAEGALA